MWALMRPNVSVDQELTWQRTTQPPPPPLPNLNALDRRTQLPRQRFVPRGDGGLQAVADVEESLNRSRISPRISSRCVQGQKHRSEGKNKKDPGAAQR